MFIALLILHDFNHGEVCSAYVDKNENKDKLIELGEDALHKRKIELYEELELQNIASTVAVTFFNSEYCIYCGSYDIVKSRRSNASCR
jgi:hypothetical protein